ncbi:hypothetical protein T484DRAFT_1639799, partial [Baffinella frigidus]
MVIGGRRLGCIAGYGLGLDLWCVPCEVGTYRGGMGGEACEGCPAGFTSKPGSTALDECTPCSIGQYKKKGRGPCLSCPEGTYSEAEGSSNCTSCPA